MNWSRAKTILIWLLLGVNLIFAANLALVWNEDRQARAAALTDAVGLLRTWGVELSEEDVPDAAGRRSVWLARDQDEEQMLAEALLGPCRVEKPGGGMAVYSSQTGEAFFRNGGLLEIMLPFEEGPFATGEDASRAVENVLHGASALPKELGMTARQEGEGWILEAEQQFQGEPVFNGVLSARLAGGGMSFFGRRVTQSDGARLDAAKNAAELVLCLGSVLSGRAENVRVDAVRQGWIASAGEEGGTLLTPAWEVKVQNETLYLDLVTGLAVIPE